MEHLGLLEESVTFYKRALEITMSMNDGINSCIICSNLSQLYISLGNLSEGENFANMGISFVRSVNRFVDWRTALENKLHYEINLNSFLAWIFHLRGDIAQASNLFRHSEREIRNKTNNHFQHLTTLSAAFHAEHLRRTGKLSHAQKVIKANLKSHREYPDELVRDYCIWGRISDDLNNVVSASDYYNKAIKIARSTSNRDILIEALLSRGKHLAMLGETVMAHSDLNEALHYAVFSGYRIYEVYIRVGLAWLYLRLGDLVGAEVEARQAKAISKQIGFYWGKVDPNEALEQIKHIPLQLSLF